MKNKGSYEEVSFCRRLGVQLTQHMTDDTTAPATTPFTTTSTSTTPTTTTSTASPPRTWTERRP